MDKMGINKEMITAEFETRVKISFQEFVTAKKELPKNIFESHYTNEADRCYKVINREDLPPDSQIELYLQYEQLKLQRNMDENIASIKWIVKFCFIASIILGCIFLVRGCVNSFLV